MMVQTIIAKVVSKTGEKTIRVMVNRTRMHPIYKKRYTITKHYIVHDEKNQAGIGDKVVIKSVAPISRSKKWLLVEILEKAHVLGGELV